MPKVFVYPEKRYEELGARRWQISWEQVRESAKNKLPEDFDFDADLVTHYRVYPTEVAARAAAQIILEAGVPFFGGVSLCEQVVDWYVEEDYVAEWRDCGREEELTVPPEMPRA